MRPRKRVSMTHPLILVIVLLAVGACTDSISEKTLQRSRDIPQWYDDAKLGIFIHWGPASVPAFAFGPPLRPGELEEILFYDSPRQEMPYAEWYLNAINYAGSETARYHAATYGDAPYADFQPTFERRVNQDWDPGVWADLFSRAGAKYVVLVTKHHDGYTLWPSAVANPNRQNWRSTRDMVGELAAAVRARGMRFGAYYSTGLDWSFQLVTDGDIVRDIMLSAPASQAYADYTYSQMVELIDRYHPDLLWADIGYPSKGRQGELFDYFFTQVPDGTVNDRWGAVDGLGQIAQIPGATWALKALGRLLLSLESDPLKDDTARFGYKTTEYDSLPGTPAFKWESTRGLGGSFAFNAAETAADMLSSAELIEYLADTVAKNGNVLINVGPDSYGHIPSIQQAPLLGLGKWMSLNGEAIYATRPWRRFKNLRGRELRYTQSTTALYAIVFGGVNQSFTIEQPGIASSSIEVLGAEVISTRDHDGLLTLTLNKPLKTSAAVVRFNMP
ncbi:MAG: alpha-L-fucosidase [Halioglobus sp.]|nr:alpha-L-fucosidase [Halioglobus sp.]